MRKSLFQFADVALSWFWGRVAKHARVSSEWLGVFRWLFGLSYLALFAPHSAWIEFVPQGLFDPQVASFAYLMDGFPPAPTLLVLDALQLVSLLAITVGFRTRTASVTFVVLEIVTSTFRMSFGKMDRDFFPTSMVLCMSLSTWGDRYSFDAKRAATTGEDGAKRAGDDRATSLLAVFTAFGMLSAGLPKLVNWVDFDLSTSGFLVWYLPNYFTIGRQTLLAPLVPYAPLPFFEIADYLAPAFELFGFVALLHSRRWWLGWLAVVVFFHMLNALFLNIWFHSFVITYLALSDWPRATRWFSQHERSFRKIAGVGALIMTAWHVATHTMGGGGGMAFVPPPGADVVDPYISVAVCALVLWQLLSARRQLRE